MGIDEKWFVEPVDELIICAICHEVLLQPVFFVPICQCTTCSACIKKWVKEGSSDCPLCRKAFGKVKPQPNILMKQLIGRLKVRCPKCSWYGRAEELSSHVSMCATKEDGAVGKTSSLLRSGTPTSIVAQAASPASRRVRQERSLGAPHLMGRSRPPSGGMEEVDPACAGSPALRRSGPSTSLITEDTRINQKSVRAKRRGLQTTFWFSWYSRTRTAINSMPRTALLVFAIICSLLCLSKTPIQGIATNAARLVILVLISSVFAALCFFIFQMDLIRASIICFVGSIVGALGGTIGFVGILLEPVCEAFSKNLAENTSQRRREEDMFDDVDLFYSRVGASEPKRLALSSKPSLKRRPSEEI